MGRPYFREYNLSLAAGASETISINAPFLRVMFADIPVEMSLDYQASILVSQGLSFNAGYDVAGGQQYFKHVTFKNTSVDVVAVRFSVSGTQVTDDRLVLADGSIRTKPHVPPLLKGFSFTTNNAAGLAELIMAYQESRHTTWIYNNDGVDPVWLVTSAGHAAGAGRRIGPGEEISVFTTDDLYIRDPSVGSGIVLSVSYTRW